MGWPSFSESTWPVWRVRLSVAPPAAYDTITRIGLLGKGCAAAPKAVASAATATNAFAILMVLNMVLVS